MARGHVSLTFQNGRQINHMQKVVNSADDCKLSDVTSGRNPNEILLVDAFICTSHDLKVGGSAT